MSRKRIWKIGGAIALFMLAAIVTNLFLPPGKAFDRHMYGHDFLPFYTAGQLIRIGQPDHLYDPQLTRLLEHQTCQSAGLVIHNEYGAFLNPPFAALPAASLAAWPYPTALSIWTAFLAAFAAISIALLVRLLPGSADWRTWGLVPLLLFTALPVWQAALHAQNTFFSLLILSAAVTLWRADKPFEAGLTAGLLLFKPQLAAIVALVLALTQGRRAIAGLLLTGGALLAINLITLPGALSAYVHDLPLNLRAIQSLPNYTWRRHVTFLAWWRMFLQGHTGALPTTLARLLALLCTATLGLTLAATIWRFRHDRARADRLIAAAIAAMPLLMPYFMDYDLTLLSVAAVLCAADALRHGVDRSVVAAWTVFYIAMELNSIVAGATPLIPAVPALAALSMVLIARVYRPLRAIQSTTIAPQSPLFALPLAA